MKSRMKKPKTELGMFCLNLRIVHNENGREMAERIGITQGHISKIELGHRNPPKDFFDRINKAYNLSPVKQEELKLLIRLNSLSEREKKIYEIAMAAINSDNVSLYTKGMLEIRNLLDGGYN